MKEKELTLDKIAGLHIRPASDLSKLAGKFSAEIFIEKEEDGRRADAKSVLSLLSLALSRGNKIKIVAEGPDEEEAVNEIAHFIENLSEEI